MKKYRRAIQRVLKQLVQKRNELIVEQIKNRVNGHDYDDYYYDTMQRYVIELYNQSIANYHAQLKETKK